MSIKTGRYGKVSWDPLGGTALVPIISINTWKGSFKTDYEDVSCFQDTNRVFIPGLMTIEGNFSGFWNSAELALFKAAMSPTPGTLQLMPNTTEASFYWQGPAYMSADIDCSLDAPKVTGERVLVAQAMEGRVCSVRPSTSHLHAHHRRGGSAVHVVWRDPALPEPVRFREAHRTAGPLLPVRCIWAHRFHVGKVGTRVLQQLPCVLPRGGRSREDRAR